MECRNANAVKDGKAILSNRWSGWICAICVIAVSTAAVSATSPEPSLKEIMQGLRVDLVEVTDGLLTGDFDQVVQAAARISQHPPISDAQAQLIASELGAEMAGFEQFDKIVHELSLSMTAAAKQRNRERTIADYQQMVNGCLACHTAYQSRVTAALGTRP